MGKIQKKYRIEFCVNVPKKSIPLLFPIDMTPPSVPARGYPNPVSIDSWNLLDK